jgi:Xaa-Pro aminopeptidase
MNLEYKLFPRAEHEARWQRAQEGMDTSGLDGLLITGADNFTYFTGGHGDFSCSRPTILLLPRKGSPVVLVHDFFGPSQERESWVEDIRTYTSLVEFPLKDVKGLFADLGLSAGRVGAELGREQRLGLPYMDFVALTRELSTAQFVDAADLLWGLRLVKSPLEIACMREAGAIVARALGKTLNRIASGMTESQAANILLKAMVEEGGSAPWVAGNSGEHNYDSGFLTRQSQQELVRGNLLWFDMGCRYNGYAADFSRMASLGEPTPEQVELYDVVNDVTCKVVAAVRPGVTTSELSAVCDVEFEKAGMGHFWGAGDCSTQFSNRAHRIGHGIGMATTEPPHVALYDHTVLAPGMTITIEPSIANHLGHFNIEENVVVTEDGCEILSTASRELFRVDI